MKSLFWKEWRENRANLLIGALLIIGASFAMLLFDFAPGFLPESFIIGIFAGLFGAWSFSKEKGKLDFLLSLPMERKTIFLGKWLFGILNILILFVVALAIEKLIYETNGFNLLSQPIKKSIWIFPFEGSYFSAIGEKLLMLPLPLFFFYNITFLLSLLFADVVPILLMAWAISGIFVLPFQLFAYNHLSVSLTSAWIGVGDAILSFLALFIAYRIFSRKEVGA